LQRIKKVYLNTIWSENHTNLHVEHPRIQQVTNTTKSII